MKLKRLFYIYINFNLCLTGFTNDSLIPPAISHGNKEIIKTNLLEAKESKEKVEFETSDKERQARINEKTKNMTPEQKENFLKKIKEISELSPEERQKLKIENQER